MAIHTCILHNQTFKSYMFCMCNIEKKKKETEREMRYIAHCVVYRQFFIQLPLTQHEFDYAL